ncbi:hypothetical protein [Endothiovibrio diazotrophicus]
MEAILPGRPAGPPPLAFSFDANRAPDAPSPIADSDARSPARWRRLADALAREQGLSRYRAETLFERWCQGRAAIALVGEEIVSYVSLIPLFDEAVEGRLRRRLGAPAGTGEGGALYESATGWTHPQWRRRGLSLHLRRALLAGFAAPDRLFLSATIGLGASRVLPGLGWQLVSWGAYPFASALIGMPADGVAALASLRSRQPARLAPYLGDHITPQGEPRHRWADHCHLWFSDEGQAAVLDRWLAGLAGGDLARWRRAVAEGVYGNPGEPGWKPFLFRGAFGHSY